jgi:bacterial/archaeal transporter family-2 protein
MWFAYGFAILGGVLTAVQAGCNTALNKQFAQPFAAALVVYAVGAAAIVLSAPLFGQSLPSAERIGQVPWWGWVGGLGGAVYILSIFLVAEKTGAALFTGLSVSAALIASLVLDHFGWIGFAPHPAGPWRILGGILMIAGVALIAAF